jgi:phage-related protein
VPPTFSAGSASVNIVPDFSNAQRKIGQWFAGMKDAKVKVEPDLDQGAATKVRAQLSRLGGQKINVEIDHDRLGRSIALAVNSLTGLSTTATHVGAIFTARSTAFTLAGGALVSMAGAAGQAGGALALLPAGLAAVAVPAAALTVGLQGVGDAFKAIASGDPKKVAEAMKNLAPAAREFVASIHDLAPAWKGLRLDVQQQLFEGLNGSIQRVAKNALPVLRAGLADNARALGEMGKGILSVAGSSQSLKDVGTIFGSVARATHLASDGTSALTQMMIDLTTVGSQFLPGMAKGFSDIAQSAAAWIAQARASGQLGQIIEVGLQRLKSLADLVFAVGKTLWAVFQPAIAAGADLISILTQVFNSISKILNTNASQSNLRVFFESIAGFVKAIQPGLAALVGALVNGVLPAFGKLFSTLGPVANSILSQFAKLITTIGPMLGQAAVAAVRLFSAVSPLINVFTQLASMILPPLIHIITGLAPVLSQVASMVGRLVLEVASQLQPVLNLAAKAFIEVIRALMPLLPPIADLIRALLPPFIALLRAIIPVIVDVVKALAPAVAVLVRELTPALRLVAEVVSWAFQKVIGPLITLVVRHIVVPMIQIMGAAFAAFGALVKATYTQVIKPIWDALAAAARYLWSNVLRPIWDAMSRAWSALAASWRAIYNGIIKPMFDLLGAVVRAVWTHNLAPVFNAMRTLWDGTIRAMRSVYDHIVHPMWDILKRAVGSVRDSFASAVKAIEATWSRIKRAAAAPINFVIRTVIRDGIAKAWNWIVNQLGLGKWAINTRAAWLQGIAGYAAGGSVSKWDARSGGKVPGQYVGPAADNVLARLNPDEFVVQTSIARRTRKFLEALNAGQAEAVQAAGGWFADGPAGYAGGGNVARARQIAQSMTGTPYIWGGAGPRGADCSGFQSIITNALRDVNNPYFRLGTTATFPWANFTRGTSPTYTIGNSRAKGHMAGTLAGVNVESGSGHGPRYGGNSLGALSAMFNDHGYPNMLAPGAVGSGGGGPVQDPWYVKLWHSITGAKDWLMNKAGSLGDLTKRFGNSPFVGMAWDWVKKLPAALWDKVKGQIGTLFSSMFSNGDAAVISGGQGSIKQVVQGAASMPSWGWGSGPEWAALDWVIDHESGWNPKAENPTSTASGLPQMVDGTWNAYKGTGVSATHASNATVLEQANALLRYVKERYRDPLGAKAFWQAHHWYDQGGYIPPGLTTIYNGTGRPEPVLTAAEHDSLMTWRAGAHSGSQGAGGAPVVHVYLGDQEITHLVDARIEYHDEVDGRNARSR